MMVRLGKHLVLICALIASSHAYAKMHSGGRDLNTDSSEQTEYPISGRYAWPAHSDTPSDKVLLLAEHESGGKTREKNWDDLSDKQQKRIQKRRKEFDALPPEEKERIRSAREKYRQLPDKRRDELRKKWRDMTPEERARYRHLNEKD